MLNNPTTIGIVLFVLGSIIGYFVRQYLAVSRADSVEGQLKIKVQEAKDEAKSLVLKSKEEAAKRSVTSSIFEPILKSGLSEP